MGAGEVSSVSAVPHYGLAKGGITKRRNRFRRTGQMEAVWVLDMLGQPRTSTSTFTQFLTSVSLLIQGCFTSTETMRTIRVGAAQDVHLDFHTAHGL